MLNLNQKVDGITIKRACSFKPDGDSTESKGVTLAVKFDNVTLQDVFAKAAAGAAIVWQNGYARKHFNEIKKGATVEINFKAPATTHIDPEQAMLQKLIAMTPAERAAKLAELERLSTEETE